LLKDFVEALNSAVD